MSTIPDISTFQNRRTPFYLYDMDLLERTVRHLKELAAQYNIKVNYAVKANNETPLLEIISKAGFGADCVSGNEVLRAAEEGFRDITFAGVGKTDREISDALESGVCCFITESLQELEVIDAIVGSRISAFGQGLPPGGRKAGIIIRINPNIDAHTHKFITTGLSENKFGILPEDIPEAMAALRKCKNLEFRGLHMHIGSQITELDVYGEECRKMSELVLKVEEEGFKVRRLSLGGGLGVDYENPLQNSFPDFRGWLSMIDSNITRREGMEIHIEPGRSIVAQCGTLISRVLYIKEGHTRNFAVLDAGMNDLIRPALYGSYHKIDNLSAEARGESEIRTYDIVGPVCESSDTFGTDRELPLTRRGDLIAIRTAGAYGAVMSSNYNLKDKAESIYVR